MVFRQFPEELLAPSPAPSIAVDAADQPFTEMIDFQEGLFALTAVAGHQIFSTPAAPPHTETRQPGRAGRVSRPGCASESPLAQCRIQCGSRHRLRSMPHRDYQQQFSLLTRKIAVRFCTEILRNTMVVASLDDQSRKELHAQAATLLHGIGGKRPSQCGRQEHNDPVTR